MTEPFMTDDGPRQAQQPATQPQSSTVGHGDRSFFWPVILIGIGVVVLLMNANVIEPANLWGLLQLWPVLLILAGLDILFGRRLPVVGALMGLAVIAAVVVALVNGPAWGLPRGFSPTTFLGLPGIHTRSAVVMEAQRSEPIGDAKSGRVKLGLYHGENTVSALPQSSDLLIDADVHYVGEVKWQASGDGTKHVELGITPGLGGNISGNLGRLPWDIRLTRRLPLELELRGGLGPVEADLSDLQLKALDVRVSAGSMKVTLPDREDSYRVLANGGLGSLKLQVPSNADIDLDMSVGAGSLDLDIEEGANVSAHISGGLGSATVDVPDDAELQVKITDAGLGSIHLPQGMRKVAEGSDRQGKAGTWETRGFAQAKRRIILVVETGAGSLSVR